MLAAEKQGPPVRFTGSTKSFDSGRLEQSEGASRARVTRSGQGEDLQQDTRDLEDEHQRQILVHRPMDRIARVQERLVDLAESPSLSHVDPFSLREESIKGIENLVISEGSHKLVQRGEDIVQSVTDEQLIKERSNNELRVARQNDSSSFEAEPNDNKINERNERLILTSESNGNDGPYSESETRLKSKGKDMQHALEQVPHRPRPLTGFTENPTPLATTDDAGIERAHRLTPSTGALVLYANRSTWLRPLPNGPGAACDERKLSLRLLDSLPLSSSTVSIKSPALFTAAPPELQLQLPTPKDTSETLASPKTTAEPNLDEVEEQRLPIRVKKVKQTERGKHQLLKKTMQQRKGLRRNGSEGGNTGKMEPVNQKSANHDQNNKEIPSPISNEQSDSLQANINRKYEQAENADLSRNDENLNTTNAQTPSTLLQTVSDGPVIVANHVQTSNRQGSGVGADIPSAAQASHQDIDEGPGEDHSVSVELIIAPHSRLARLGAFLLPRFIRRHEIPRISNDNAEDTRASTISGKSDRKGRPRTNGLRFSRRLTMLIKPRRMKKRGSALKRLVFLHSRHAEEGIVLADMLNHLPLGT